MRQITCLMLLLCFMSAHAQEVLVRAGVVHALAGRADQALDALERAKAGGISPRTIETEEDFAGLRPLPRFAALVSTRTEVKR